MQDEPQTIGNERTMSGADAPESLPSGTIDRAETLRAEAQRRRFRVGDSILGRYQITGELGQGGMGVVFRCFDEVGGIDVAVKALPPEVSHSADDMEEIRDNFRLVESLHHPRIAAVKTLERDAASGEYYLVMECVEGVNLRRHRRAAEGGVLPLAETLRLAGQVAEALDEAHRRGVLHRDVKPGNIMVSPAGDAKVLDFGLAAEVRSSLSRRSVGVTGTSGTPHYMPPEQWEGRRQGPATDLYALAATVYELLAGEVPFKSVFDSGNMEQMQRVVASQPPEPIPGLDRRAWAAIARALSKNPEERFASCGEFVAALGGAKTGKPRNPRKTRKGWLLAAVLVLLVVLGLVSHGSYQSHRSRLAEAAAAEQATAEKARQAEAEQAALDAAQRAKVAELSGAVRAALAAGDLQTAGERLSELAAVSGDTSSLVAELRAEYEGKAGERETNSRYASASVERDKAVALDRGQTFGPKLDALEIKWREAEAARQGKSWGQALSGYDAVLSQCKALHELDAARTAASAARAEAEQARRAAAGDNAAADAKTLFDSAGETASRADAAFKAGDFAGAEKAWTEAAALFGQSGQRARSVQAYAKAKSAYDTAIEPEQALLEQHGGTEWQEVLRQSRIGAASGNDPVAGADAYAAALAALPEAVAEAGQRRRTAQVEAVAQTLRERVARAEAAKTRAAWDEALTILDTPRPAEPFTGAFGEEPLRGLLRQLDALKTESLAGQRAARIEGHLVTARRAKEAGRWADVVSAAEQALALDATHREAQALKREGESNLVPSWKLVATVDGREVPATITIGGQTHTAPRAFTLEDGKRYEAEFSYEAGGRKYRADAVSVTADWKGERERRVALEEVRGPVAGRDWTVPETGMEFVWIRQLNLWVGKYEVTNGEYRHKDPQHDSKAYERHSLNGDRQPVVYVNWDDAVAYAAWLTERERAAGRLPAGMRYRLPTEEEFMAYAQCGDGREYPWGSNWPPRSGQAGNYQDTTGKRSFSGWNVFDGYDDGCAVACDVEKDWANPWGLYGVGGNVWECCAKDTNINQSFGAWRGASWFEGLLGSLRCADRLDGNESSRNCNIGFRLVVSP